MVKEEKRYIDIARLMDDLFHATVVMGSTDFLQVIRRQPTADVAPVVHGQWIVPRFLAFHICGVCRADAPYDDEGTETLTHFCPNCGAKMDGGMANG